MTCYPTQSHYPDTEPTSLNNVEHKAREQQVSILKSLVCCDQGSKTAGSRFDPMTFRFPNLPELEADAIRIRPLRLVDYYVYSLVA